VVWGLAESKSRRSILDTLTLKFIAAGARREQRADTASGEGEGEASDEDEGDEEDEDGKPFIPDGVAELIERARRAVATP
jgi:hypothetical protein